MKGPDLRAESETVLGALENWRRDLHRHPELAFQEQRTAGLIARELHAPGLGVRTGIGGTGVIGSFKGEDPGRR